MPVLRYFVFVGGVLLAVLFVCDAVFPQIPLPATLKSGSDLPAVRIRSERRWPERVVIDTTVPMVAPVKIAKADTSKTDTSKAGTSKADSAQQTAVALDVQKVEARDAFAQMGTARPKAATSTRMAETAGGKSTEPAAIKVADATPPKAAEFSRSESKPKRRVAKIHSSRSMMLVAQQPQLHFGFFDSTW